MTAVFRLAVYFCFTTAVIPIQSVALACRTGHRHLFPQWYHQQCCRIMGIRVERRGRQSRVEPTLYVSNHSSYIDITVLGSVIRGSFVAKAEVARWPFFGLLAKLQRTVFIDRHARKTAQHRDSLMSRLEAGDNLILFPEGTSDDGNRVRRFKSSLLSVAEGEPGGEMLTVQPVSITYTRLDGLPLGRHLRPYFAWYGDMDMAPHMWRWAGLGRLTVTVHFHRSVRFGDFGSRKALSEHCEAEVARGMARALSGRPQPGEEQRAAA